jgi:hypothetical protein
LLGNSSVNTLSARQILGSCDVIAVTDIHAEIVELLEGVFSVRSMPRLRTMDKLPEVEEIHETNELTN